MHKLIFLGVVLLLFGLAGCSGLGSRPSVVGGQAKSPAGSGAVAKRGGGYYQDDGPGDNPPPNLDAIPDAEPRAEPLNKFANNPYTVLGRTYVPDADVKSFRERGLASWYGRKFHGQKTSSGEPYDMYGMTAAHRTLPIPSYARVTNLKNRKSVIVRINDRGPFHSDRVIDLSYTAAYKLGIVQNGSAMVEVDGIDPNAAALPPIAAAQPEQPALDAPAESGIYLQMGAFRVQENAEQFRDRLIAKLTRMAASVQVLAVDGLYRVHLGPLHSRSEAGEIAQQIQQALDVNPLMITR
jgi:rare lipoprotein A